MLGGGYSLAEPTARGQAAEWQCSQGWCEQDWAAPPSKDKDPNTLPVLGTQGCSVLGEGITASACMLGGATGRWGILTTWGLYSVYDTQ